MKKIAALLMCTVCLFAGVFSGCDSAKGFSITDVVWSVEEKAFEGKNTVVFSYKNNSQYTIVGVNITFRQKENLSVEELAILEKYAEFESDLSKIYITANNYYFTKSNEESEVVPCDLVGSWNYCHDMDEYGIMQPTELSVAYIQGDKIFGVEYDFKSKTLTSLSEKGKDAFQWTEGGAKDLVSKPNKQVVQKGFDFAGNFSFSVWDASEEDFNDYVDECKAKGFVEEIDTSDYFNYKSYKAKDENGNQLHIYYRPQSNHREPCRIEVSVKYQ